MDGDLRKHRSDTGAGSHVAYDMLLTDRNRIRHLALPPAEVEGPFRHAHAQKRYVILSGFAELEVDGVQHKLFEGDAICVAQGQKHLLRNGGKIGLEVLEIRTGVYLGDDDHLLLGGATVSEAAN